MKIQSLFALLVVCAFAFLSVYPADAVIYGKRGDDEAPSLGQKVLSTGKWVPAQRQRSLGLSLNSDPKVTPGSISITPMSTLLS